MMQSLQPNLKSKYFKEQILFYCDVPPLCFCCQLMLQGVLYNKAV